MVEGTGLEETKPLETTEQPKDEEKEEKYDPIFGPDNLENLTPAQLKEVRSTWNKNYTQKRQGEVAEIKEMGTKLQELERQNIILVDKTAQFEQLASSPEFLSWAQSQMQGKQPTEYTPQIDDEKYEDADGARVLLNEIGKMIDVKLANQLSPVMQSFATTRESQEFVSLVELAKKNNWVDPNLVKKEIDVVRRTNPNLSLTNAYSIAESGYRRSGLDTRPSVIGNIDDEIKKEIPTSGGKQITNPPTTNLYQARNVDSGELLDKIIEDKRTQKTRPSSGINIRSILSTVLKEKGIDKRDV